MKDIYNEKYTPPYTWLAWWELQGMRMLTALAGGNSRRGAPGVENYCQNDDNDRDNVKNDDRNNKNDMMMIARRASLTVQIIMMSYGYLNKSCF